MQFAARLLTFSATISQALALVAFTNSNWAVTEGTPFEITWTDADGAVTLLLKDGPSTNLATVQTIASGLTGTSYTWTPSGIPSGTYAVEITDSEDTNYGSQFTYAGTGTATTSASASATSATTASVTTGSSSKTDSSSVTTGSTSTTSGSSTLATSTVTSSSNGTSTASSTSSSSTKSSSKTATSSSTTSTSTPINTNDSQKMGSPLALVLLTVAAVALCH